jgi:hypothetical protein
MMDGWGRLDHRYPTDIQPGDNDGWLDMVRSVRSQYPAWSSLVLQGLGNFCQVFTMFTSFSGIQVGRMEPKGQIFVWRDIARHTSAALPQLCLCLVQRIWVCLEMGYPMYFRWLIIIFPIFPIKTWSELRVHLPFSDNKAARLQSCLRIQCQAHQKTGSSDVQCR